MDIYNDDLASVLTVFSEISDFIANAKIIFGDFNTVLNI